MERNVSFHQRNFAALTGPYSPFTYALQEIRNKLIASNDSHEGNLDLEYIKRIISLSIPLHGSREFPECSVTFPIAAYWPKEPDEEPVLHYSGQYAQADDGIIELKENGKVIKDFIRAQKNNLEDRIIPVDLEQIISGSSTHTLPTQYPQILRRIKGFFRARCDSTELCVFLACQVVEKENALCPLCKSSPSWVSLRSSCEGCDAFDTGACASDKWDPWAAPLSAFREYFLSSDVRAELLSKLERHPRHSPPRQPDSSRSDTKSPKPFSYRVIRDILSKIQEDAVNNLCMQNDGNIQERQFDIDPLKKLEDCNRRVFSVVFVAPAFTSDGQVSFRYILTNQQIQMLNNISKEKLKGLIDLKRQEIFDSLTNEFQKTIGSKPKEISKECTPKDFLSIIIPLLEIIKFDGETQLVEKENSYREAEEVLRSAILAHYAFQDSTVRNILGEKNLSHYMDSIKIKYGQAFLLDQVLDARQPDIMISMVNHPLSKLQQCLTLRLIDAYMKGYPDKELLYPAGLLLLESLFLQTPLFLYPIYHYDTPILLCAFDAMLHLGSWQFLKSMVDAHTDGIFSAVLSNELDESQDIFKDCPDITGMNKAGAANIFAERVQHLLLRFCSSLSELNSALKRNLTGDHVLADIRNFNKANDGIFDENGDCAIQIEELGIEVFSSGLLITQPSPGRDLLRYYAEALRRIFLGYWELAKVTKKKEAITQSLRWAHSIKTELGSLLVFDGIMRKGSKPLNIAKADSEHSDDNVSVSHEILIKYLDNLQCRVESLQMSFKTNIAKFIDTESSFSTFDKALFTALRIAILNLLLSNRIECIAKRKIWIKPELNPSAKDYNISAFRDRLLSFNSIEYAGDNPINDLISQAKGFFIKPTIWPITLESNDQLAFAIPGSADNDYYLNALTIILSEVIINAIKYMKECSLICFHIDHISSYNQITIENTFSKASKRKDEDEDEYVGVALVRKLSELIIRPSEWPSFIYREDDSKGISWVFRLPIYKPKPQW